MGEEEVVKHRRNSVVKCIVILLANISETAKVNYKERKSTIPNGMKRCVVRGYHQSIAGNTI